MKTISVFWEYILQCHRITGSTVKSKSSACFSPSKTHPRVPNRINGVRAERHPRSFPPLGDLGACLHPGGALTFGRPCWHPARRPPASSSGRRSCLPAAPPSGCCRSSGCRLGSQTLKKKRNSELGDCPCVFSASPRSRLCTCPPLDPYSRGPTWARFFFSSSSS